MIITEANYGRKRGGGNAQDGGDAGQVSCPLSAHILDFVKLFCHVLPHNSSLSLRFLLLFPICLLIVFSFTPLFALYLYLCVYVGRLERHTIKPGLLSVLTCLQSSP